MRLAARRENVLAIVRPFAAAEAERILAAVNGALDLPAELSNRVPVRLVARYLGLGCPDEDASIAARKASGGTAEDLLGRCLAMQAAGLPGMTDLDIRNNLIGATPNSTGQAA